MENTQGGISMFELPITFKDENESYITMIALKNFSKKKGLRTNDLRNELIDGVINFANSSPENEEEVLEWIDHVTKEGIKDIWLKKINLYHNTVQLLKNPPLVEAKVATYLQNVNRRHISTNQYNERIKLVKYEISETVQGTVVSFYLCKLIIIYDTRNGAKTLWYPINVDIYVDKQYITGRAKSKSNMYEYNINGYIENVNQSLSVDKEVKNAIDHIASIFNIDIINNSSSYNFYRAQLYKLLDEYTHTPLEIQEMMSQQTQEIQNVADIIRESICSVNLGYKQDIESDVNNLVEKYLSISFPDKTIFTRNRIAYPLTVNATDEEESHLEQTAGLSEPLQSKAIFFDNKKMMQKSLKCDSVKFCYYRLDSRYSGREFSVKITAKKDGCLFKFTEFTLEEDIVNVLFSLINA